MGGDSVRSVLRKRKPRGSKKKERRVERKNKLRLCSNRNSWEKYRVKVISRVLMVRCR